MTEKQESILTTALSLFAKEGYSSTSTSKVAKHAGVSEGLIFRHFGNKEGLLAAIIQLGEKKAKLLFADVVLESDPKALLCKYLEIGLKISSQPEDVAFWKLQFKIKWELEHYGEHKIEALSNALAGAFRKLRYDEPEMEAKFLIATIDGIATQFMLQENYPFAEMIAFIKKKYKL